MHSTNYSFIGISLKDKNAFSSQPTTIKLAMKANVGEVSQTNVYIIKLAKLFLQATFTVHALFIKSRGH